MRRFLCTLLVPLALLPGCLTTFGAVIGGKAGAPSRPAKRVASTQAAPEQPGEDHSAAGAMIGGVVGLALDALIVTSMAGGLYWEKFPD